jgi:hypothetical protein
MILHFSSHDVKICTEQVIVQFYMVALLRTKLLLVWVQLYLMVSLLRNMPWLLPVPLLDRIHGFQLERCVCVCVSF